MKTQTLTQYLGAARAIVCALFLLATLQLGAQENDYTMYIHLKGGELEKVSDGVYKVPVNSVEKVEFQDETGGTTPDPGNHEWVDLGLPSGTLWATCNVGASSPEEYGDYFAWGETTPKETYNWSTYIYCNGSYDTMTKYCWNSIYGYQGFTDGLTELMPEDDAATANWGEGWQMPSIEQYEELINSIYTTTEWTTQNGVNGRLITSKSNGNRLFLPAAGGRYDTSLGDAGSGGHYWSRSLYAHYPVAPGVRRMSSSAA